MMPFDGLGYGCSIYWNTVIKQVGKDQGEECPCWADHLPQVIFQPEPFTVKVRCASKQVTCKTDFTQTEQALTEKFLRFYKV